MRLAASLLLILAALAAGAAAVTWQAGRRERAAEAAYPPTGEILQVNGVPVHAHIAGSGPDLILIHGAGGSTRDMTFRLADRLASDYRVIAFDRPGHGYTGRPPAPAPRHGESPREQALLLQSAARQLGVKDPIVVGQSFGGAVAMAWALEAPRDTGALVILAGATMPWTGPLKAHYRINASALGGATLVPYLTAFAKEAQTDAVLDAIFRPAPVPEGYAAYFGMPMSLRRGTMRANAQQVVVLRDHVTEMSAHYDDLQLPVELVHGDADTIVPVETHAIPLSKRLPDAKLTVLPGAGHMPQHSHIDQVVEAINRAAMRRDRLR